RWLAGSWRLTRGGCPRWCSRRAACGGWRAAGGARVAAARGGARGARPAAAGGQLAAHAWRLPAVVLEARGLRWLAGSWRRKRGGARVAAARGGA
ncbi:unnamed protein product, partial [Prorocentrum cordatum]